MKRFFAGGGWFFNSSQVIAPMDNFGPSAWGKHQVKINGVFAGRRQSNPSIFVWGTVAK